MALPGIFIIGDSISIQYHPYLENMLSGKVEVKRKSGDEALENLDIPTGANGGDSSMVLAYLCHLAQGGDFTTDLLLINCGLHDIKTDPETGAKQIPLENYQENLEAIVKVVTEEMKLPLVWIRTTPADEKRHNHENSTFLRFRKDQEEYNAAADRIMAEKNIPILDLCGFTTSLGGLELFCDHVHFTEEVREKQAAYIAGWVERQML